MHRNGAVKLLLDDDNGSVTPIEGVHRPIVLHVSEADSTRGYRLRGFPYPSSSAVHDSRRKGLGAT